MTKLREGLISLQEINDTYGPKQEKSSNTIWETKKMPPVHENFTFSARARNTLEHKIVLAV